MALDATISGVSANTYQTDVQFLAYGTGSLASARLTASTTDTRERALRTATRMIDRLSFEGYATVIAQALQWPRYTVYDPDRWGQVLDYYSIPRRIREATCELALALLAEGQVSPDGGLTDASQYVKAKVDVIEVEYRQGVAAQTDATGLLRRYPAVFALLAPLLVGAGALEVARA